MDTIKTTGKPGSAMHTDRMLLYSAILIGAFLRIYRLGHQSIWGDEALTLQVYSAGSNFAELWANIWDRAFHPPLYFLIVHYWYLLGQSEFMLRFPSAVFGIVTIPIVYLLATRLFGSRSGAISALVVAVSPFHIWYSQEARMYTLQVLLVAVSYLFLVKAWKAMRARDLGAYVLAMVLGLFTHMSAVLLVGVHGLLGLGAAAKDWRRYSIWIGAQIVVLLAFMPWVLHFLAQRKLSGHSSIGFDRETSPVHLAYALYTLSVGQSLGPSVSALHYISPKAAIQSHLPVIVVSALLFGILAMMGLIRASRANRFGFWVLLTGSLVPIVLVAAASLLPGVPLNPRYIIVAAIPYWIILGLGIQSCASSRHWWTIPTAASVLVGAALLNYYFRPVYAKQDVRSAVELVNAHAMPDDVIIISSIEIGGPFIYYFDRKGIPYYGYPPRPGIIRPERMPADMDKLLSGHKRVWLVLGRTWSSDPEGILPSMFRARYPQVEYGQFQGASAQCFILSQ